MLVKTAESPLLKGTQRHKKLLLFFAAPLLVLVMLTILYIIEGIWPFGDSNISYADMAQAYVPRYYHLFDAMNGDKSIFFDWYTGTGINMSGNFSTFFSPLNLLFYFFPREYILESMSIFLMIRMALMSFTAFYFMYKVFPRLDNFFKITFGVMYAFCGYVLQYYTNIMWLDTAALFPILILTLLMLLNEQKLIPYICALTFGLILSFYLSFMSILFILFASGLYILLLLPKEKRKKSIFYLGTGTVTSLLLAAGLLLPQFLQMSSSARTSSSNGYFDIISITLDFTQPAQINKLLMLLGAELLLVLLVKLVCKIKEDKNGVLFFLALVVMMIIPIFFEGVNLLWHTGSYADFPLRFGYIITFVLLWAAGYYLTYGKKRGQMFTTPAQTPVFAASVPEPSVAKTVEQSKENAAQPKSKQAKKETHSLKVRLNHLFTQKNIIVAEKLFFCAALIGVSIPLLVKISKIFDQYGFYSLTRDDNTLYQLVIMVAIIYIIVFALALSLAVKQVRNTVISVALLLPVFFYSTGLIGVQYKAYPEHDDQYIARTLQVQNALSQDSHSVLERIKNADVQLNTNYPLILERSAISNWTHMIPKSLQTSLSNMGYSTIFTRTLDSGGSVFTDALLGITNTLTLNTADSNLYRFNQKAGDFNYYDNIYTLPFGITADETILNNLSYDVCASQNALYQSITGTEDEILHKLQRTASSDQSKIISTTATGGSGYSYQIQITGKEVLYFWSASTNLNIYVNGQAVKIPTYSMPDNLKYKANFNNKLIALGTFENESISVTVTGNSQLSNDSINFATLSLEKMDALTELFSGYTSQPVAGDASLSMTIKADSSDKYAFIPICYDKGWSCTVNGEEIQIEKAAGSFMAVPLQNGVNQIEMHFVPGGLIPGVIISGVTLLCAAGLIWLCKARKRPITVPAPVLTIAEYVFFAVLAGAVLLMYVMPILYSVYQTFYKG